MRRTLRSPRAGLLLVLALALVVRLLLFFHGVRGSDAYVYARHAALLASGEYSPFRLGADWYGYRYTIIVPTALAYRLFGVGDWPSAMFPLLFGLGSILVVFRLARLIFDAETALWSALVFATLPLSIACSTGLGADSFIPFFSGLAVLALLEAERTERLGRRAAWLALMGLAFYACVSARLVAVVLLLFFVGYGFLRRCPRPFLGSVLLALGLPLALEGAVFLMVTGDPLTQWHEVAPALTSLTSVSVTSLAYYPRAMVGLDLGGLATYGFFFYLAAGGAVVGLISAPRAAAVPLLWLVPVLGFLEFGSISPTRYVPIHKSYNYLSLVTVPAALLAGYCLSAIARSWPAGRGRAAAGAVAACVVLTSLYGAYRILGNSEADSRPYVVVYATLTQSPARPIYVHHFRWKLVLDYFFRYRRSDIRMVWDRPAPTQARDAYLVVHDRYLYWTTAGRPIVRAPGRPASTQEGEVLPEYLFAPPPTWALLDDFSDRFGHVRLFWIPDGRAAAGSVSAGAGRLPGFRRD